MADMRPTLTRRLAIVLAAGVIAGCGTASDDAGQPDGREPTPSEVTSTTSDSIPMPEEVAAISTTTTVVEQPLTTESGFTAGTIGTGNTTITSAGTLVTNPNADVAAYKVEVLFNLRSADGTVLESESEQIPYIPAGATVPIAPSQIGYDLARSPTGLEVIVTGEFRADEGWDGVEFGIQDGIDLEISGAAVVPTSYGVDLTAQVTNPSQQVVERTIWDCVFKSGGVIVGGEGSRIRDRIPPGTTVAIDTGISPKLVADEVICRAYG